MASESKGSDQDPTEGSNIGNEQAADAFGGSDAPDPVFPVGPNQPLEAQPGEDVGQVYEDELAAVSERESQAVKQPAAPSGNRVIGFLRASWSELQRVQWPDRRAVAQATAVVLGFVVVAGAFLGLADLVAQQIVDAII